MFYWGNALHAQSHYCPGPVAAPYPVTYTQPDGLTIQVIGRGSGALNYMETTDGYTLIALQDGTLAYALPDATGRLVGSGIRAHDPGQRQPEETQFLSNVRKNARDAPAIQALKMKRMPDGPSARAAFPSTGNRKVLTILIQYPDLMATNTVSEFDNMMNQANYNGTGSFRDFYTASSFGQLTLDTDVFGWYTAANNYTYYADDNGTVRARELGREAVDAAEAAGVDFSIYDNDNDGNVDGVIFVHAGPGAEEGGITNLYIWSHRNRLSADGYDVTYDGVHIDDYMINPERRNSNTTMVNVGVFCHEFGHGLGLPDLYDTDDSNGDSEGIGWWGLMGSGNWAGGEASPTNFSAWSRIRLGWESATDITGQTNGFTLSPASQTNNEVYRLNTGAANEYFLLENRQNVGIDVAVPGHGMIIWHIDDNQTNNKDETHKWVDVEEADNDFDLDNNVNRGDAGDPFPGTDNNKVFNDTSAPNSKRYDGSNTNTDINNIREEGTLVRFNMGCEPANAICRAFLNLDLNAMGTVSITTADVDNGSTFDCGFAGMSLSKSVFTCADIGYNSVTLTVEDVNGNTDACTINVYVYDHLPPVLTVPADVAVACWYSPTGPEATGYATAVDNCDNVIPITYTDTETDFEDGSRQIDRLWRAEDDEGNVSMAGQVITVPPPMVVNAGDDQTVYVDFVGIPGYPYSACATLDASAWGGTPPYTYAWSDGQSGASVEVCPDVCTQYTVTVTDANGCEQVDDLIVYAIIVECMEGENENLKYLLCHNGETICTAFPSTEVHLSHGDGLGACGDIGDQGCEDILPVQAAPKPVIATDARGSVDLVLTPNPARDVVDVTIRPVRAGEYRVGIYSTGGLEVFHQEMPVVDPGPARWRLPVNDLAPGIYFLRVDGPDGFRMIRTFGVNR